MFLPAMFVGICFIAPAWKLQNTLGLVLSGLCLVAPFLWLAAAMFVSLRR